jgi:hypothetical protein
LELTTNAGGTPLPKSYFKIDTAGVATTSHVNLLNYSRTIYTYKWFVNGTLISTNYNAVYTHDMYHTTDTVKLVVSNGTNNDTTIKYAYFYPPVIVSSFTPTSGGSGTLVTITGSNFTSPAAVSFGGVAATGYTVVSPTTITATVGSGASGNVQVNTTTGSGSLPGFTFIPPPTITSFTPTSAATGTMVTITGTNFNNVSAVSFAGVAATSFTVVSSTTITAIAPSGPSGSISVTTVGGNASLSGYISLPTVSSFTPQQGTQGTILQINGTSFPGTTSVTVGGVAVQSFTINSANSITAIVSTGATGSVTVTKPGGSSSLPGFTWFPAPTISTFTPTSGPVGTTVTITGTNFNAVPANNIVYFGAVKATVTSGNTTSLIVTVPVGATYYPITVVSNNLVAYSNQPFVVTFPNGGSITSSSFANDSVIFLGNDTVPMNIDIGDLDNDGKMDLIVSKSAPGNNSGVYLYRNISTLTNIAFAAPVSINGLDYKFAAASDLDGDGKLDLVISAGNNLTTYRNVSSPGNFSFASGPLLQGQNSPSGVAINDVDGDGKADIAVSCYPTSVASVFRNTSDPGTLRFAARVDFPVSGGRNLLLTDLNGDHKPELVVPDAVSSSFYVLKNNCTIGNISFGSALTFPGYTHSYIAAGDFDGDGKNDLVLANNEGSKVDVYRNLSTATNINFAAVVEFPATSNPRGVAVSDLDGDGQTDIAIALYNSNLALYKNIGSPGNISFSPKVEYLQGIFGGEHMLALGDINGDGKNDAIITNEVTRRCYIHINNVTPSPFIKSFTPTIGASGTVVTITGNNFTGVTAVTFGGVGAASFTVNSDTSITATVSTGASGVVSVTNNFGTASLADFVYQLAPVITSFSPLKGPIGTSVVITGNNFSSIIAGNQVYFGKVKATVTAATATSITVTVPVGATPDAITVTTSNKTGYSSQIFGVTFPGGASSFTQGSFDPRIDRPLGASGSLADIDGDGKLDLVMGSSTTTISVARNTGTPGTISFASNISFPIGAESSGITTGDIDGDGKLDVLSWNYDYQNFSILRNLSTPGNISFGAAVNYPTGISTTRPDDAKIVDLDLDGKPDIIVANYYSRTITVFRNLSTPGNFILDSRIDYLLDGYVTGVGSTDIDGDGKPELIAAVNSVNVISVFKNISVPGTISFANKVDFPAGIWPNGMETFDLDDDGKADLVFANINSPNIGLLRNTSTVGTIAFASMQTLTSPNGATNNSVGDLDGDGKPENVGENGPPSVKISIFKNNSVVNSISMSSPTDYTLPLWSSVGSLGDLDGDGRLDMVAYVGGGTTSFFRNRIGGTAAISGCAGGNTSVISSVGGNTYQWQLNNGSGFANLSNNSNYSGTNTSTLQINNISSAWNGYQYRCVVDTVQGTCIYTLTVNAGVTPSVSIASTATTICAGTSVTFTATPLNGGAQPSYQWQVNGLNVGTNSPTYTTSTLTNNAQVKVILTSNATCASPTTVTSNIITMTVNSTVTPSVTAAANATSVCPGTNVTFTATPANGGTNPSYQWKLNGNNVGTNSNVYSNNSLVNGDIVNVLMTSNASCASPTTVGSNWITMVVSNSFVPTVGISSTATTICSGANVTFTANPTNGGTSPTYQWKLNGVNVGTNSSTYSSTSLNNNDAVSVVMTSSLSCASPTSATSNVITMTVNPSVVPTISISGATTITQGQASLMSSLITNGGSNPLRQWQDSTTSHTWQNIPSGNTASIIYTPAATGDKIRCWLNSNQVCAIPQTVYSNVLVFTVNAVTGINPVVVDNSIIRLYPDPVHSFLTIDSLKLNNNWKSLEVLSIDGKRTFLIKNISNKQVVTFDVSKLPAGLYFVALHRKSGQQFYLKFVKD